MLEEEIATSDPISAPQGTEIILRLASEAIPSGVRKTLARAILHKASGKGANQSQKLNPKEQKCMHLEVFIPKKHWEEIFDESVSFNKLQANMKHLMERMGLTNGSEHTYVAAVSSMVCGRIMSTKRGPVNPHDCLKILETLKDMVRCDSKRIKLPHHNKITGIYPASPEELRAAHPDIYDLVYQGAEEFPENGPCQCPLDPALLETLKAKLPARKSHNSVRLDLGTLGLHSHVQKKSCLMLPASTPPIDLPGFKWCGKTALASTPFFKMSPQDVPALTDGCGESHPLAIMAEAQAKAAAAHQAELHAQAQAELKAQAQAVMAEAELKAQAQAKAEAELKAQAHANATPGAATSIHELARQIQEQAPSTPDEMIKRTAQAKKKKKGGKSGVMKRPAGKSGGAPEAKKAKTEVLLPYPGAPTKPTPPLAYKTFRIFTDIASQAWRVKKSSGAPRCCSFATDAKDGWAKVNEILKGR